MTGLDPTTPDPEEKVSEYEDMLEKAEELPSRSVEPTRYGDWEKNGRCIDF